MEWTPDEIAEMKAWWVAGQSATTVAASWNEVHPDNPITRNTILGLAHREEWERPKPDTRKRLPDLCEGECKWPFDGPRCEETGLSFLFCAEPAAPGRPYCRHHMMQSSSGIPERPQRSASRRFAEAVNRR